MVWYGIMSSMRLFLSPIFKVLYFLTLPNQTRSHRLFPPLCTALSSLSVNPFFREVLCFFDAKMASLSYVTSILRRSLLQECMVASHLFPSVFGKLTVERMCIVKT